MYHYYIAGLHPPSPKQGFRTHHSGPPTAPYREIGGGLGRTRTTTQTPYLAQGRGLPHMPVSLLLKLSTPLFRVSRNLQTVCAFARLRKKKFQHRTTRGLTTTGTNVRGFAGFQCLRKVFHLRHPNRHEARAGGTKKAMHGLRPNHQSIIRGDCCIPTAALNDLEVLLLRTARAFLYPTLASRQGGASTEP
jgi:hypothetical protein